MSNAIAVLLTSIGVPVYGGIMAMENNAMPYEFGNTIAKTTVQTPVSGDIIYFEIYHFGQMPNVHELGNMIIHALVGIGAYGIVSILEPVLVTFTSIFLGSIEAYGLSLASLEFGLSYAAAGVSISIGWPVIAAIATVILAA